MLHAVSEARLAIESPREKECFCIYSLEGNGPLWFHQSIQIMRSNRAHSLVFVFAATGFVGFIAGHLHRRIDQVDLRGGKLFASFSMGLGTRTWLRLSTMSRVRVPPDFRDIFLKCLKINDPIFN
ncbi:MAG: hypothetical protein KGJ02_02940 [Verrucomicrobiota bacterium]|nr:hypothetical protein [Verrucomicrobiota bacterium]